MYGIYANIWGILMVNVTIYSIHRSYGLHHFRPNRHRFFFREIDPWAHLRASRPGKRGAFGRPMAAGSLDMTCLKRASS